MFKDSVVEKNSAGGDDSNVKFEDKERDGKIVWSGINRHFKVEHTDYAPQNGAEIILVEKLNNIPVEQTWGARHSKELDFGLRSESRYFLPDGSTNPNALLEKGTTRTNLIKNEVTNTENISKVATGVENEWGIVANIAILEQTGDKSNPIQHTKLRSTEVRYDSTAYINGSGEEVIELMIKHDCKDDREARRERILKFNELAPKLVDISKAVNIAPILLPDDELVSSFRANSIEGIPAQYLESSLVENCGSGIRKSGSQQNGPLLNQSRRACATLDGT